MTQIENEYQTEKILLTHYSVDRRHSPLARFIPYYSLRSSGPDFGEPPLLICNEPQGGDQEAYKKRKALQKLVTRKRIKDDQEILF